ncbi:MAG: hypothetical protein EOO99_08770 [Pedobacter sp.]|nr:MAG: hypothetical protein EOO99_08770 [Pedobacter sp.]
MKRTIPIKGDKLISPQEIGSQLDVIEEVSLKDERTAKKFFPMIKERLLSINKWGDISKMKLSTFKLMDENGNPVSRKARVGDYIRIDIPGPGPKSGNGFDWVRIEDIITEEGDRKQAVTMRVRPAQNPQQSNAENADTAHFFSELATSTFSVIRFGRHIYAEEHGRNEVVNSLTSNKLDKIRNKLVGLAATLGFSYPQWKSLVKGLIQIPQHGTE